MEFWDDYDHSDPKLTYIVENIKSQEIEEVVNDEFCGCDCSDECNSQDCSCLQRSGAKYIFQDKLVLANYTIEITNANQPIYECNNNCKCKDAICGNKLVQFGPRKKLKTIETESKGLGLITEKPIASCNFICEYAGEVIDDVTAQERFKIYQQMNLQNNYIFCINENFGNANNKIFIDPTFHGNIGRYINHSCQPNSDLILIRVHDVIPKLCIFAKEYINEQTEITFNYGSSGRSSTKCMCLSPHCRGFLPCDNKI